MSWPRRRPVSATTSPAAAPRHLPTRRVGARERRRPPPSHSWYSPDPDPDARQGGRVDGRGTTCRASSWREGRKGLWGGGGEAGCAVGLVIRGPTESRLRRAGGCEAYTVECWDMWQDMIGATLHFISRDLAASQSPCDESALLFAAVGRGAGDDPLLVPTASHLALPCPSTAHHQQKPWPPNEERPWRRLSSPAGEGLTAAGSLFASALCKPWSANTRRRQPLSLPLDGRE